MKNILVLLAVLFAAFTKAASPGTPLYSIPASNSPVQAQFYFVSISMDGTNIVKVRFDKFASSNDFVSATQALRAEIVANAASNTITNGALRSLIQTSFDTQAIIYAAGVWTTSQVSLLQIRLDNIEMLTNWISRFIKYEAATNLWFGDTLWLGTNSTITSSTGICINVIGNVPSDGVERFGQLNIVADGADVTVTNLGALKTSDGLTTRVLTNGQRMVIGAHVQANIFSNAAIGIFK